MTRAKSCVAWLVVAMATVAPQSPAGAQDSTRSLGQRLYVPIYSEIPYGGGRNTYRLAATLAIRNVDPKSAITLLRADYYDSKGKLLQKYVEEAVPLGPLGSHHLIVKESERRGGIGANFIVEWRSNKRVVPALAQAVMITDVSLQGIAFLSDAVVIEELNALPDQ
jgi:hypothetical protein